MAKKPNRQELPPHQERELFVVGTPIGNLKDLTPRAKEYLEKADPIFCEDTRVARRLLSALKTRGRLIRIEGNLSKLKTSLNPVLVSDAGTPGVSDPGSEFVREARKLGFRIRVIPGASAVTALMSVSGFASDSFSFHGFFPRKKKEQEEVTSLLPGTHVWFESPQRILKTVEHLENAMEPDTQIVLAKEMTKIHESYFYGSLGDVRKQLADHLEREGKKGEWSFALKISSKNSQELVKTGSLVWKTSLSLLIDNGIAPSHAAKVVSQEFDVKKKQVYELALHLKESKRT